MAHADELGHAPGGPRLPAPGSKVRLVHRGETVTATVLPYWPPYAVKHQRVSVVCSGCGLAMYTHLADLTYLGSGPPS